MVGQIFRILFSRKSRNRLKEISDYHQRTSSPLVAGKVARGLKDEAQKLERLPSSRPTYPGSEELGGEVRYAKKWSYKIIFEILNPEKLVRILTIRHDAEDPEDIMDELR